MFALLQSLFQRCTRTNKAIFDKIKEVLYLQYLINKPGSPQIYLKPTQQVTSFPFLCELKNYLCL